MLKRLFGRRQRLNPLRRSGTEPIRVICTSVDHYGFWGRDHHPEDRHIGRVFTVKQFFVEGDDLCQQCGMDVAGHNERIAGKRSAPHTFIPDPGYHVFECVSNTGETVEFIGHEVEVL